MSLVSAWLQHQDFKSFAFDLLHHLRFPNRLNKDWVEFFNWLGQEKYQRTIATNKPWSHSEQLAHWFAVQPEQMPGLLNILGALALSGSSCPVPNDLLEFEQYDGKASQYDALMIRISKNNWEDCAKLAKKIVAYLPDYGNIVELSLTMLKLKKIAVEQIGEFALALWQLLLESNEDRTEAKEQVLNVMTTVMNAKKSTLSELEIWQRLRLPVLT